MAKKVLIIEDEKDYRALLRHYLEREGYGVTEAPDGKKGLLAISEGRPDLVLLDIVLPGMDGYQVLERIRKDPECGKVPVIIITIQSKVDELAKGLRLGADDYVVKPFNPKEVLARVSGLLKK